MKVAVVGSRDLALDITKYIPENITELISGGARGIDNIAERWADEHGVPKQIFKPNYNLYGRAAPIIRNRLIVKASDIVIAIWDGKSKGTKFIVEYAKQIGVPVKIIIVN